MLGTGPVANLGYWTLDGPSLQLSAFSIVDSCIADIPNISF